MAQGEDVSEKTSIVSGDTFNGTLRQAEATPPALQVLIGPTGYVGRQWLLTASEYIVGRSPESGIFIDDRSVSRNHAKISVAGSDVTIRDLDSSNKTAINNSVLQPNVPSKLQNNDQIKFGNVIVKFLEKGNLEAAANRQLSEKAEKDALTGAYNKGALIQRGPEAVKRAEVLKEPLSILTFDIDHFKKINDTYGHAAGDYVLRELSGIVRNKLIRSNDYFARSGGEEFVLILSGAPQKNALEVAERVRSTIQNASFVFESKVIPVTISVGGTTRIQETEWNEIMDRADRALYQSKQTGRNKVSFL
jgi:diguanylate cyclase (GGDEF)-like protein